MMAFDMFPHLHFSGISCMVLCSFGAEDLLRYFLVFGIWWYYVFSILIFHQALMILNLKSRTRLQAGGPLGLLTSNNPCYKHISQTNIITQANTMTSVFFGHGGAGDQDSRFSGVRIIFIYVQVFFLLCDAENNFSDNFLFGDCN